MGRGGRVGLGRGGGWLGWAGELGVGGFGWAVERGGALAGRDWGETWLWVMTGGVDSGRGRKPHREQGPDITGTRTPPNPTGGRAQTFQESRAQTSQNTGRGEGGRGLKLTEARGLKLTGARGQGQDLTGTKTSQGPRRRPKTHTSEAPTSRPHRRQGPDLTRDRAWTSQPPGPRTHRGQSPDFTGDKVQTSQGPGRRPHRGQGIDLTGART